MGMDLKQELLKVMKKMRTKNEIMEDATNAGNNTTVNLIEVLCDFRDLLCVAIENNDDSD